MTTRSNSPPLRLALALAWCVGLTAAAIAVDRDKALYVGGTLDDYALQRSRTDVSGAPPQRTEGRINLTSERAFAFEGGTNWGTLTVPYTSVTAVDYGIDVRQRGHRGLLLLSPWDPIEQFTGNAHNLLTLAFQDQTGRAQVAVMELGRDLIRPTLETLERRTGKTTRYVNVEACLLIKSAADCHYGTPGELKGRKRVFLDSAIWPGYRDVIRNEIARSNLGLEVVERAEGAEIVLKFRSAQSPNPGCPCEGGRGEVFVAQNDQQRVVLVFTTVKRGTWGKSPLEGFATTFVEAFRKAQTGS
jgi:hypothetical protein